MSLREGSQSQYRRQHRDVVSAQKAQKAMFRKRVLFGVTIGTAFGFLLWLCAVASDAWFSAEPDEPILLNRTKEYFLRSYGGLWQVCRTLSKDGKTEGSSNHCQQNRLAATEKDLESNHIIDKDILGYARTESAFTIISFVMMVLSVGFSLYTMKESKYTFKRLAGAMHLLTAATVLVVIEVFTNTLKHSAASLPERHPPGLGWSYGASYILGWFTFTLELIAGLTFFAYSRKKKAKPGAEPIGEEPQFIDRV